MFKNIAYLRTYVGLATSKSKQTCPRCGGFNILKPFEGNLWCTMACRKQQSSSDDVQAFAQKKSTTADQSVQG